MSEAPAAPDPFWAVVHRRHPDVDLVVLPPRPSQSTVRPPDRTDAPVTVDGVPERVAAEAARLWLATVPCSRVVPETRWEFAADLGTVRATARSVEIRGDGILALGALARMMDAEGWRVRQASGPLARVVAGLGGLELTASYAEPSGALLLTVGSETVAVGRDAARELVRAGR